MRVAIIGAGNVATVFGRLIKNAGHEIIQVISRSLPAVTSLGKELECNASNDFNDLDKTANLFILAMSDAALNEVKEKMNVGDKIVVHTAGAVSSELLKPVSVNYGALYPLQSLNKANKYAVGNIPLFIDGNNEYTKTTLKSFAETISNSVNEANDEERLKLHIAAVISSNFTNHLYALTAEYCEKEQLDFKLLLPLITETAMRLQHHQAKEMQTGPAARKDIVTLDKHLRVLTSHPHLRNIYLKLSDSIMNYA